MLLQKSLWGGSKSAMVNRVGGMLLGVAALFGGPCLTSTSAWAYSAKPTNADYIDEEENIFLTDEVTVCEITMDPNDFNAILADPAARIPYPCDVRWVNSKIDETITNVGIHARGNTSINNTRKNFKLDINHFVPGQNFHGLEKMNLNGDQNDPTMLRRMLAHEFLLRMGLASSRTHYVAVYVNGVFRSIKIHTEQIDEEFTDSWFGTKDGNLYKCLYKGGPADLNIVGSGQASDYENYGGPSYEEGNNDPNSDYSDLAEFIQFINSGANTTTLQENMDHYVNVDSFLRYLASNVATGSWDDYWYGSNNYYLYQNTNHGKFEWIPFDYDNTFGTDFFGTDWSQRDITTWGDGGFGSSPAPLHISLITVTNFRKQFVRHCQLAKDILSDPTYQAKIDFYHNLIAPWFDGTIENGGVTGTASGQHFTYFNDYNNPTTWAGGSYHTMGILPFMNARAASLQTQIDFWDQNIDSIDPLPNIFVNEVVASNTSLETDNFGEYEDWVEIYNDEETAYDLSGWHLSDDPSSPTMYQIPAGTVIPGKGFLRVWADGTPAQTTPTDIHTNFKLGSSGETVCLFRGANTGYTLINTLTYPTFSTDRSFGRFPDGADTTQEFCAVTPGTANDDDMSNCNNPNPRTPPSLYINEYMADNESFITDNAGEYEDWIEIYNDETTNFDLGGLHLTDDLLNRTQYEFAPGTIVPAKGFLVVWADDDGVQETPTQPHANFKLGKGGEAIGLYDNDANNNQLIHSVVFGAQTTDMTEGLLPDGVGSPQALSGPTPGVSNTLAPNANPTVAITSVIPDSATSFYDDPFSDYIHLEGTASDMDGTVTEVQMRITASSELPFRNKFETTGWIPAYQILPGDDWSQWFGDEYIGVGVGTMEIRAIDDEGAMSDVVSHTWARMPEENTVPRLFINEFMADNTTTITDNFGEPADWIEIYNDEETDFDLSGLYLTDDLWNPTKWQFPAGTTIASKGFLLVWADSNELQSTPDDPHTNFSLSKNGEHLGLFHDDAHSNDPIYIFVYRDQQTDVSQGLYYPEGHYHVELSNLPYPTPGYANLGPANHPPTVKIVNVDPGTWLSNSTTSVNLSGTAKDTNGTLSVVFYRVTTETSFDKSETTLWQPANNDSGDWTQWSCDAPLGVGDNLIEVRAVDDEVLYGPIDSVVVERRKLLRPVPAVFINEFKGPDVTLPVSGEKTDKSTLPGPWVEIYNAEESTFDLSGMYLTNDLANPTMWQFPEGTTVEPDDFLLVLAFGDDSGSTPTLPQTNFVIDPNGGELGLFDNDNNDNQVIHDVSYGTIGTSMSIGLFPDGFEPFQILFNPTPGTNNSAGDPPQVSVTNFIPSNHLLYPEDSVHIEGTASDGDENLLQVSYRLVTIEPSTWSVANNNSGDWSNWSIDVPVIVGTNLIQIQAIDTTLLVSTNLSVVVTRNAAGELCDLMVLTQFGEAWGSLNVAGTFQDAVKYGQLGFFQDPASGWKTMTADFNADNLSDMAVVTEYGEAWTVTNLGNETFGPPTKQSAGYLIDDTSGWTTLTGDFNGDGAADLAQFTEYHDLWVGYNDGAGNVPGPSLAVPSAFTHDEANGYWLATGDVTGDGRDDIVQLEPGGLVSVAIATPAMSIEAPTFFGFTGFTYSPATHYGTHLGDFNDDGKVDLCQITEYGDAWVSLSTGTAFSSPTRWGWLGYRDAPDLGEGWWVFAGDANGDGIDDLIQLNEYGEAWVAESTGRGAFLEPVKNAQLGFHHKPNGPWQMYVTRNVP